MNKLQLLSVFLFVLSLIIARNSSKLDPLWHGGEQSIQYLVALGLFVGSFVALYFS